MEDLTGRTIDGYQIVEKIGRGGMATVFRAYQPSLDRDVAIKVLPPYYAEQDETFLQRFKREARAIAKLRHPNILMVMDFGEEDDIAYLVMEYVTAGTLKERMKRPIKLDQIYNLVGQVGSALEYAHDLGVVHRDIKPANIMMPKPDWALLTDFGLATMVGGGSFLTQSGMTVGTPAYMSPEQGSGERVDHRTDIYAMGIMLYEMVVGEVPYTAETPMAVVVKHIVDPLPIPRDKNPEIPENLQRVILKSLAKNPDDRYQRASDFVDALQTVANIHPDWSATEIRTVTSIRTPQEDRSETKRLEEEKLTVEQTEVDSVPPLPEEQQAETQVEEKSDQPSAEPASESSAPPPILEQQVETQVQEAPDQPPSEPDSKPSVPSSQTEDVEETTIAQIDDSQTEQPTPKKRPRWLVITGGVAVFFVCAFFGLVALNNIFGGDSPQNSVNEPLSEVANDLPVEELADEIKELSGEEEIGQVADLLRQGEFDRAREAVPGVLRRHPAMWEHFMGLVGMQFENGQIERAAKLLETGLEAHPDAPPENYAGLGWLYMEMGRPNQALAAFEATLRRYPGYPEAHEGLIHSALEIDQPGKAIRFLEGLSEQFPGEPLIFRSLGELHKADGNLDAAIGAFNTALEMDPNNPMVLISAYHAYHEIGEEETALDLVNRAVEVAPEDPTVLGQAGWAYLGFELPEQAVEVFEIVLSMEFENAWNTLGLAKALMMLNEQEDRIPELLHTAERSGTDQRDTGLLMMIGWTYREMGDCDNAVRLFTMVEEFEPGNEDAKEGINSCR